DADCREPYPKQGRCDLHYSEWFEGNRSCRRQGEPGTFPVVIVDTRVDAAALKEAGGVVASFIGSDNFEGGKLAGEFIVKALSGKGNIAILEGIPGHETGDSRLRGFHSVVDGQTGLKVVASQPANWERAQCFNVLQNILQSHPDLQAVFACSAPMALGAFEAIRSANRGDIC